MRIPGLVLPCLLVAVQAAAALHSPDVQAWEPDSSRQARLLARQVIVEATVDSSGAAGRARAAIWIAAPREQVYAWLTDCSKALSYVPHLTACRIVEAAPDQSWKVIAHEIDYSWFLPRTRYVFRAMYQPPARVDFQEVSGDLVINRGSWILESDKDGRGTLLAYEVRVKPRMYVPTWLVRRSLRKDLPELLAALRRVSETGR